VVSTFGVVVVAIYRLLKADSSPIIHGFTADSIRLLPFR
jgi:hypothetical protein